MKLRKALVAAATALTVATAGTVVAQAQETTLTQPSSSSSAADANTDGDGASNDNSSTDLKSLSSDDEGNPDSGAIKNWIGVFTAVIGALSAAFAFITRYLV